MKGEPAKYAEMIRHKIEAVVAIKNNGAALRHQIATNKNVVDPFVYGPRWINVSVVTRVCKARTVRMALGKDIMKILVAVQHRLYSR